MAAATNVAQFGTIQLANIHRSQISKKHEIHECKNSRLIVGLSWDRIHGVTAVDLDLQAVIIDRQGLIVDAIHHSNESAMGGAMYHSGDEKTGERMGCDEKIYVKTDNLPQEVKMIVFVVAAMSFAGLKKVANGQVQLKDGHREVAKVLPMERTHADVDCVAVLCRNAAKPGQWEFYPVGTAAKAGSHFMDILEPTIGSIIRERIPGAPKTTTYSCVIEKPLFNEKPQCEYKMLRRISAGIGGELKDSLQPMLSRESWNKTSQFQNQAEIQKDCCRNAGGHVVGDIDLTASVYSKWGTKLDYVDGDTPKPKWGIAHSGDNAVDEHGDMDDEFLTIDLDAIPDDVWQIYLVMTVKSQNFSELRSAYCRASDEACNQLTYLHVDPYKAEDAFIWARVVRGNCQLWKFQPLGIYVMKEDIETRISEIFLVKSLRHKQIVNHDEGLCAPTSEAVVAEDDPMIEMLPTVKFEHFPPKRRESMPSVKMNPSDGWDRALRELNGTSCSCWP